MSLLTFKGGVHPNDGKALAKDKAIVQVQPKGDLVYPMSQHIGAPATPVVAVGDKVLKGQPASPGNLCLSRPAQRQNWNSYPNITYRGFSDDNLA